LIKEKLYFQEASSCLIGYYILSEMIYQGKIKILKNSGLKSLIHFKDFYLLIFDKDVEWLVNIVESISIEFN